MRPVRRALAHAYTHTHTHGGSYLAAFRELPKAFIDYGEKVAINLTKGLKACHTLFASVLI